MHATHLDPQPAERLRASLSQVRIAAWMTFLRAMDDQYDPPVRQSAEEVVMAATWAVRCDLHPPAVSSATREAVLVGYGFTPGVYARHQATPV